jgi:D-lactate dehydrogenase (cytochrome)
METAAIERALATEQAFLELKAILHERVTAAQAVRDHHSRGEDTLPAAPPDLVCFPQSTQEVSGILRIAAAHRLPVVPFGSGTSLEGHVQAVQGGICIDMMRMNRIVRVSPDDMDATVESGVTRGQLEKALDNTGLTFFVDPGADASFGGMASTAASGTATVRYGAMRDNVLALTVVLADGRIIHTGTRARKSAAGYDLTHLFIGAEGTLGVITEITLRLHAQPEAASVGIAAFPTIQAAIDTVIEVIQLGVHPARIEFLDENQVKAVNSFSAVGLAERPTILFEFHGVSVGNVTESAAMTEELCQAHGCLSFEKQTSPAERERLWKARHDAYFAARALRPGSRVVISDACVPISRLAECIVATRADLDREPFPAVIVGHVGDGNFHVLSLPNDEEFPLAEAFAHRLVERALAMDGTCTGEHGIGLGKKKYLEAEHGETLPVMRAIKQALDPENRMNPGKIFDIGGPAGSPLPKAAVEQPQ